MLLNNPSTFRDTTFWWICFPHGLIMETIFPPHPKKSTKNRHIFRVASTDRLARRSVTSIPSGGGLLFPFGLDAGWPGSMVGLGWKVDPFKRWTFFRLCSAAVFFILLLNTYRRGGIWRGVFFFLFVGSFFFLTCQRFFRKRCLFSKVIYKPQL